MLFFNGQNQSVPLFLQVLFLLLQNLFLLLRQRELQLDILHLRLLQFTQLWRQRRLHRLCGRWRRRWLRRNRPWRVR